RDRLRRRKPVDRRGRGPNVARGFGQDRRDESATAALGQCLGLRRLLPLPRRSRRGGQTRGHGRHSTRWLRARQGGDRSGERTQPGDGLHRYAPFQTLKCARKSDRRSLWSAVAWDTAGKLSFKDLQGAALLCIKDLL